jgi:hypothetical protein
MSASDNIPAGQSVNQVLSTSSGVLIPFATRDSAAVSQGTRLAAIQLLLS